MGIEAILALIPLLTQGITSVADLVTRLQAEGRTATADEVAGLKAQLDRVAIDDAAFDAAFGKPA